MAENGEELVGLASASVMPLAHERAEREAAHRFYAALGYEEVSRRFLKEV